MSALGSAIDGVEFVTLEEADRRSPAAATKVLDARNCRTLQEFYRRFETRFPTPFPHGHNLNALRDTLLESVAESGTHAFRLRIRCDETFLCEEHPDATFGTVETIALVAREVAWLTDCPKCYLADEPIDFRTVFAVESPPGD